MEWLDRIVHSFIMTFGITQPNPQDKRIANLFIGVLLFVVVLTFLAAVIFGVRQLAR